MILFKFKETHEDKPRYEHCGRRGWRWVFEVDKWKEGVSVGFSQQVIFHDRPDPEWRSACDYFAVSLTKHFMFGSDHAYYDGPHCSFSLGFFHFNWSYWWCKKCMPD
jgi:hypothetical protein